MQRITGLQGLLFMVVKTIRKNTNITHSIGIIKEINSIITDNMGEGVILG